MNAYCLQFLYPVACYLSQVLRRNDWTSLEFCFARLDAFVRVELDVERAVGLVAEEGTESFERVTCVVVLCVALTRIVEVVRMVSVILVVI